MPSRSICTRLGAQAADDIVAETFLAAFRRRGTYDTSFALHAPGRDGRLPDGGWDEILLWAYTDLRNGTPPDSHARVRDRSRR